MVQFLVRMALLLAIFASVFLVSQILLKSLWARRAHTAAVNKRLQLLARGRTTEQVMTQLRKNALREYADLPAPLSAMLAKIGRTMMASAVPFTALQAVAVMGVVLIVIAALLLVAVVRAGFPVSAGTLLITFALAFCVAFALPMLILTNIAERRRKRVEQQFPLALDVFVRALRAGHPIASAIELLTKEMEDPIGSEFGLVSDEVSYGSELTSALSAMAERWDLEDIRMFVVSLSVQNETGGNLAEILQNLSDVIRARAGLYMKVRALSSEGRMTGWMLSVLPILTFIGLFVVNPSFYLDVAQERMFIIGAIILIGMYTTGLLMIRRLVDIKV
jgi:tight adherence protein B